MDTQQILSDFPRVSAVLQKLFLKRKKERKGTGGTLPNSYKTSVVLILKQVKKHNEKDYRSVSLIRTDSTMLNKILESRIKTYITRIIYLDRIDQRAPNKTLTLCMRSLFRVVGQGCSIDSPNITDYLYCPCLSHRDGKVSPYC